jgi:hypothetical protein
MTGNDPDILKQVHLGYDEPDAAPGGMYSSAHWEAFQAGRMATLAGFGRPAYARSGRGDSVIVDELVAFFSYGKGGCMGRLSAGGAAIFGPFTLA